MSINNTNVFYTLKRINKIIKSLEAVSLKKSQMQGNMFEQVANNAEAIQAAHEHFKIAPIPNQPDANRLGYRELARRISDAIGLSGGLQNYAQLSLPNSPFFNALRFGAPAILADNGILNGDPYAMNKKPISERPRIFVAGPSLPMDHGNGYFDMHTMLNRAMKLLGITHQQEPIFIFSQPHEAKSNFIYLNNIANGISPSYERNDESSTSMDPSGLTRAFARTFGHDTFELPTVEVQQSARQALRQFMDTIGVKLATHAIILGQPDPIKGRIPQYDSRVFARRLAEEMGIPVLTTNKGYEAPTDAITSRRAQDLRNRLGIAGTADDIHDVHITTAQALLDPNSDVPVTPNIRRTPSSGDLSCVISAPPQWDPPSDQYILRLDGTPPGSSPKMMHYTWSYADSLSKKVAQQRRMAQIDDQHWVRLMSGSPYRTMSGSFLYFHPALGGKGNAGPLFGPSDFVHSGQQIDPFMTLTPNGKVTSIPYLFADSERSLHGTTQMDIAKKSNPYLEECINDITDSSSAGQHELHSIPRVRTYSIYFPREITSQFLNPTHLAADQKFAVFCTHLKRDMATRPITDFTPPNIPLAVQNAIRATKETTDSPVTTSNAPDAPDAPAGPAASRS